MKKKKIRSDRNSKALQYEQNESNKIYKIKTDKNKRNRNRGKTWNKVEKPISWCETVAKEIKTKYVVMYFKWEQQTL